MGVEFQLGKIKSSGEGRMVVTIAQKCECAKCYRTVHLIMVKLVNFFMYYFTTIFFFLKRKYHKEALGRKVLSSQAPTQLKVTVQKGCGLQRQTGFLPPLVSHVTNTLYLFSNFCFLILKMGTMKQDRSESSGAFLKSKILLDHYNIYSPI